MDDDTTIWTEDDNLGRLLQAAGPREQLPDPLKRRWEARFRGELESVRAGARQRSRRRAGGLAAGVIALAIALSVLWRPPLQDGPRMQLATLSGTVTASSRDGTAHPLVAGQTLAAGQTLTTGGDGYAAVNWAGYDLRLNRDTRLEMRQDGVALQAGEIYVSDDPHRIGHFQLVVTTPFGTIRDLGTQFTVVVQADATVATVRRGAIELAAGSATLRAAPNTGSAGRLSVNRDREIHSEQVSPGGRGWRWIYRAAPGFSLEGRSARDFLRWSVGESGLQLQFDSPAAETYARTTILHGSIEGLDPEAALAPVLAATDLDYSVDRGSLRVYLRP